MKELSVLFVQCFCKSDMSKKKKLREKGEGVESTKQLSPEGQQPAYWRAGN